MRIGLFLKNLDEEYQISIYRGIRKEAEALRMDLVCIQGELPLPKSQDSACPPFTGEPFPSRKWIAADGILFLSSVMLNYRELASGGEMQKFFAGMPLVSIGNRLSDYPSIVIKSRKSMEILMDHLISFHGYRKLLYIGGPENHQDNMEREQAFRKSIRNMKGQFSGLQGVVINSEFLEAPGRIVVRDYMLAHRDNPPDVIVAANDNMAIGVQGMLRSQGDADARWRDCPVTGFDDIDLARLEVPALTTIRQPLNLMGQLAVRTLRDIIDGKKVPRIINIESELVIRNSCGCKIPKRKAERGENIQYQSVMSEYHLRNVSLLGQSLSAVNSSAEMLPHLRLFLNNLDVKTFYLILYPRPLGGIGSRGNLVYQRRHQYPSCRAGEEVSCMENPRPVDLKNFFIDDLGEEGRKGVQSWCVYHLRSGNEYLGIIVYEASDLLHPQLCSAAILLANTVKRLLIQDDEKERAREMERVRFSMDLHDDICQRLAGISMFCKSLIGGKNLDLPLQELSDHIEETLKRTRQYAHDSFPMDIDTLELKESLMILCREVDSLNICRCRYTWSGPDKPPLSPVENINVYRIVQEALQNAVKHAGADLITVDIGSAAGRLTVRIRDNGRGNLRLGREQQEGFGLRSMRYRAHQLGAEYIFDSSETAGTLIEVRIPVM
jgi:signal transduction histidine kinase